MAEPGTDGPDNAEAPASEQPETTGAETASGTKTQQPDYAALMARIDAAEKAVYRSRGGSR